MSRELFTQKVKYFHIRDKVTPSFPECTHASQAFLSVFSWFSGLDTPQEHSNRFVGGVLRDQLALEGSFQDALEREVVRASFPFQFVND